MKKEEQVKVNKVCEKVFSVAIDEMRDSVKECTRLRSCQAHVYETNHFYVLRSYNTLIACISKRTDTLYDMLRHEYGYTNTSAQHIAKFNSDYCRGYWGCERRLTWRSV